MATMDATRVVLLRRQGVLFVEPGGGPAAEDWLRAFDLHLADLGFCASTRLREVIAQLGPGELEALRAFTMAALARPRAADRPHVPLFRKFPDDIPTDTTALWIDLFLIHFLQGRDQPCLFCRRVGTTHVLSPCMHVICDACFDGGNYSACPVCKRACDPSPFFQLPPAEAGRKPNESVRLQLIDHGDDLIAAARELVAGFCARRQPMSPTDRDDLTAVVRDVGAAVIPWLPERIPVKENLALVMGTLLQVLPPDQVLPVARRMLATATDVMRVVAVWSGADASLAKTARTVATSAEATGRWHGKTAKRIQDHVEYYKKHRYSGGIYALIMSPRFKPAKIRRPQRRALLAILEGMDRERLIEDMLRHRSLWVRLGERLHPHEYADRFPNTAAAFAIVRERGPDGALAPAFQTFGARLEAAADQRDAPRMLEVLRERPGELARRLDHVLRLAGAQTTGTVLDALKASVRALATPVLLTLWSRLPTRALPAKLRVYWPKGQCALGATEPDRRKSLSADAIARGVSIVEAELLRRFAAKPPLADVVIDAAMAQVIVPFNERTASRAAVALPRGSVLAIPDSKALRLFLHWCQPKGGRTTDVDLSVAFYDGKWKLAGVCSYYQLTQAGRGGAVVARSSGDHTSAPFPDGASEFVDIDRAAAIAAGFRYAAMVVNAYSGMPFSELERATAGVMLREDLGGAHFDARTVELAFDLQGENGMYLPLVVDLDHQRLHWLDMYASGQFAFNNVATSNRDIARIGPAMIDYFAGGERPSMRDLALLHAAARAERVFVRYPDGSIGTLARQPGEPAAGFLARLRRNERERTLPALPALTFPALAVVLRGDLALPPGSTAFALIRDQLTSTIAASDLLT